MHTHEQSKRGYGASFLINSLSRSRSRSVARWRALSLAFIYTPKQTANLEKSDHSPFTVHLLKDFAPSTLHAAIHLIQCLCVHVHVHVYVCVCVHLHVHVNVHVHVHVCVCG